MFSWCDNSDGNLAESIISDFLQIAVFAKYYSTLNLPLLQYMWVETKAITVQNKKVATRHPHQ